MISSKRIIKINIYNIKQEGCETIAVKLKAVLLTAICLLFSFTGLYAAPAAKSAAKPLFEQLSSASAAPTGYSPQQIKKAYEIDSNFGTGKGKTIAIVTAYGSPNLKNDIDVFDSEYGLPDADIIIHNMGSPGFNSGWALETTLDVQWAHAMAPDAKLLVVVAPTAGSDDLTDAVDYANSTGAQIISMSWGSDEGNGFGEENNHFTAAGKLYLAASGDNGAASLWPACAPNVIAIGGTTLKLGADGTRISESAWSKTGGGTSIYEDQPSWQKKFGINSSTRTTPDISFVADPATGVSVYAVLGTKTVKGAGTPSAAPALAHPPGPESLPTSTRTPPMFKTREPFIPLRAARVIRMRQTAFLTLSPALTATAQESDTTLQPVLAHPGGITLRRAV